MNKPLRICQVSDTHAGITSPQSLEKLFKKIAKEQDSFDILVHCGDYCGTLHSFETVESTVKRMRRHMPDKPMATVIGNHDYWVYDGVLSGISWEAFEDNYNKIKNLFDENNIHFFDVDGPLKWRNTILFGHSGWYTSPNPPTNDARWMPSHSSTERGIHRYLLNKAHESLNEQFTMLTEDTELIEAVTNFVFVSHFPVIKVGGEGDYKGRFEDFSWSETLGKNLEEHWKVKYFLNGHAHQLHKGPLRWECGSDYQNPKWHIVEIK